MTFFQAFPCRNFQLHKSVHTCRPFHAVWKCEWRDWTTDYFGSHTKTFVVVQSVQPNLVVQSLQPLSTSSPVVRKCLPIGVMTFFQAFPCRNFQLHKSAHTFRPSHAVWKCEWRDWTTDYFGIEAFLLDCDLCDLWFDQKKKIVPASKWMNFFKPFLPKLMKRPRQYWWKCPNLFISFGKNFLGWSFSVEKCSCPIFNNGFKCRTCKRAPPWCAINHVSRKNSIFIFWLFVILMQLLSYEKYFFLKNIDY